MKPFIVFCDMTTDGGTVIIRTVTVIVWDCFYTEIKFGQTFNHLCLFRTMMITVFR